VLQITVNSATDSHVKESEICYCSKYPIH